MDPCFTSSIVTYLHKKSHWAEKINTLLSFCSTVSTRVVAPVGKPVFSYTNFRKEYYVYTLSLEIFLACQSYLLKLHFVRSFDTILWVFYTFSDVVGPCSHIWKTSHFALQKRIKIFISDEE